MLVSAGAHVRIIDRPCGSGKTTRLLRSFQPDRRYLVVVPLLSEVERVIDQACVSFQQPIADQSYGTKKDSLEMLLRKKLNVVTTHALYGDVASFAKGGLLDGYDIVVDEVPEVLSSVGDISRQSLDEFYISCGYATINDDGRVIPSEKWHLDHQLVSDTLSEKLYQLSASGMLYVINDTFLLWVYPKELLTAGRTFTVLTYLARGSLLLPYLEKHGIDYVHDVDRDGDLGARRQAAELIEIRDIPRMKGVKLSYTGQTNPNGGVAKKVSGALLGLRRNDLDGVPLGNVVVTCAKANWYHRGRDDVARPEQGPFAKGTKLFSGVQWIPNTTRGTNDYAHATHLIYLYEQYMNPAFLRFLGISGGAQDRYAVAELIQVIYRTRVRNGEKIVVYVPSPRMRKLLEAWLRGDEMSASEPVAHRLAA